METDLAVTEEELVQVLSSSAFGKIYNLKLHSVGVGELMLLMPFQESIERPGGVIAGSVYMTAADVAMWLAIMTLLGKDAITVTTTLNTTFLNSAKQVDVKCAAKILKLGKSLIYGVAECRDMAGRLLTHHTITYMRIGG
ncbi:MAG TPA: PaaI family thioesterase [Pyrinomonadaceae bacterium]|nr:PaaI family thioesterase [Pyrinomonadaceae bacterium]